MVQRQLFPGERERSVRTASREARHSFVPKTYGGGPNGVPLLTISDAMKVTLYEFCLLHHQEELLEQWDPANLPATPQNVTYGTRDEYWWQCEKGHRWQAPVKSRTSGRGCPYCTTRRLQPGVNDFATRFPDIAAQWHPTKNGAFQPDQVAPGSHRKAWWRCKAGHEWQASVTSRTSGGSGCPVCAGRLVLPGVNDFASAFPTLAAQWHPTKNNGLRPEQVAANSNRSVWWQCEQGHTWRAPVGRRVQFATGCPYCTGRKVLPGFNDLASLEPPGRRPVGHGAQRVPPPRPGDRGQRQARLVALRGGARLESKGVFPDGEDAHRLPRLRRGRQDQFHPPLPCACGGAERGDPAKINQINQTKPLRACVRTSRVPLEGACNLALLVL